MIPALVLALAFLAVAGGPALAQTPGDDPCRDPLAPGLHESAPRAVVLPSIRDGGLDALRLEQIVGGVLPLPLPSRGGRVSEQVTRPAASPSANPDPCPATGSLLDVWRPRTLGLGLGTLGLGPLGPLEFSLPELHLAAARIPTAPLEGRLSGPRWTGRGDGAEATVALGVRLGPVSLQVAPHATWVENLPFDHPTNPRRGFSPLSHSGHMGTVDLPRRRGDSTHVEILPGESELRLELGPLQGGVSTRSLHWGPARRNPLVLAPSGPGFPHVFVGTRAPVPVPGVGIPHAQGTRLAISGEWILGELRESGWFDLDPRNDRRQFAGGRVSVTQPWIPGLEIGAHHARVSAAPEVEAPTALEIGSLFARWVVVDARTEVYLEWGRENLFSGWLGRAPEIRGVNAFTVGAEQVTPLSRGWLRTRGELTSTRGAQAIVAGGTAPSLYTHGHVIQGYTHLGFPLGAPIGPGSDAQFVGVDWIGRLGSVGLQVERIRHDDDSYARLWSELYFFLGHDVEVRGALPFTLRHESALGVLELEGELLRGRRWNRHFTGYNRSPRPRFEEWNTALTLGVRWRP
jgi:hypothetical protein